MHTACSVLLSAENKFLLEEIVSTYKKYLSIQLASLG